MESKPWVYPKKTQEQAGLIGFIKSCRFMGRCSIDQDLVDSFKYKSKNNISDEMIDEIEDASLYSFGLAKRMSKLKFFRIK